MNLFYYINRFFQLPAIEKRLLVKGYALSLPVLIMIYAIPIKYYINIMKSKPKHTADDAAGQENHAEN